MYNIRFVTEPSNNLSARLIPVKLLANKFVDFHMTMSEYFLQNRTLKLEIEKLRKENDILKISLTTIKNFEHEFNEIKKTTGLKYTISAYKVIEKVLGFDDGIYESFMLISASHKNIVPGTVIISSDGVVGIVHDINEGVARVRHISDPKLNIPVQSSSGEHFIISGNGEDSMISNEIKENNPKLNVTKGDLLVTSGEGGVFHHGIPIAIVEEVIENSVVKAIPVTKLSDVSFVWAIDPVLPHKR
jgi:rod shape-determining protein MreC